MGARGKDLVYAEYFWHLNVQGISEVIRSISDFQLSCILKTVVVERNGPQFIPQGYYFSVYEVVLSVKC